MSKGDNDKLNNNRQTQGAMALVDTEIETGRIEGERRNEMTQSVIMNTRLGHTIIPPPHETGFNIQMAREFARRNSTNPVWRAFKAKWDGKAPRRGSKAFAEFVADAEAAQQSIDAIFTAVRLETK